MKTVISNPPYNMKWEHPIFAQLQTRFLNCEMPPESNANYAFILTALDNADRSIFILPYSVLDTNGSEKAIVKYLVDSNYIEAVILCPDNMFESTNIATCIVIYNKNKSNNSIMMCDSTNSYEIEIREQKGQFGSSAHTNRTYEKKIKILSEETINKIINNILNNTSEINFSKEVDNDIIKQNDYKLSPKNYIDYEEKEEKTRSYEDILTDLNRIIKDKNLLKLTINETIARDIGLNDIAELMKKSKEQNEGINQALEKYKLKIEKEDYISLTKNKNELSFSNNSKNEISHILMMIMNTWKNHMYYLNQQENIYLIELRDKLIPDLMNGKIDCQKQ